MTGVKPPFGVKRELQGLELPNKTVLEIEIVQELQGEVRFQTSFFILTRFFLGQWSAQTVCCLHFGCDCYSW